MSNDDFFYGAKPDESIFLSYVKGIFKSEPHDSIDEGIVRARDELTTQELILDLIDKVDRLEARIELIFGDHVFIKGRLVNIGSRE